MCYTSAMDNLKIMAEDFAQVQMLVSSDNILQVIVHSRLIAQRYGQDSTTVMTAYSAVVLMKVRRARIASHRLFTLWIVIAPAWQ